MKCPLNANRRIRKPLSIGFVALLLLSFVMVTSPSVRAEHPAQVVWVEPASIVRQTDESFTVDVKINITDPDGAGPATGLFGFEYKLNWSSTVLNVVSIQYHIPTEWTNPFEAENETRDTSGDGFADWHWVAVSTLAGTGFAGVTSICTYNFNVAGNGSCTLDLYHTEFTSDGPAIILISDTIPAGTTVDGYFTTDPHPRALFTYSPKYPDVNQTVTFNASDSFDPDGTIVSYDWDFGDTYTGSGEIVTHNFTASGVYNVTLTVTDNASPPLTDTTWHIVMVDPPVAKFTVSPTEPLVNQVVTFDASISYDLDGGNITQYSWDFGDFNTTVTNSAIITHIYIAPKEYKITLTVTDDEGATGSTYKFVTVSGESPVASFTWSPEEPKVGETVTFNASDSFDPDGTIAKYEWDFGDGNQYADGFVATHSYETAGSYNVTLKVTDNEALENTATHSITIAKTSSSINITASETTIDVGEDTTISGYITPAREDVNVTIHYRLKDETTWNTTTDTTGSTGGYSYVWTPDEAGTYEVKASWQGDVNTLGAESSIITVTVEKAAAPDYLVYGLIAIVIIIVAALAVYFLKIRK